MVADEPFSLNCTTITAAQQTVKTTWLLEGVVIGNQDYVTFDKVAERHRDNGTYICQVELNDGNVISSNPKEVLVVCKCLPRTL